MGQASDTQARVAREQYEDYLKRFKPIEEQYAGTIFNDDLTEERIGLADSYVQEGFDTARDATARNMSRFGLEFTGDQARTYERSNQRNETLARVSAKNMAREESESNDLQHLMTLVNYGRDTATDANALGQNAASMEQDREIHNRSVQARNRAANRQAAASLAMMAMYFA